jgi:hypothetical protein
MRSNNRRLLKFKAEGRHYKDLLAKIYEPALPKGLGMDEKGRAG